MTFPKQPQVPLGATYSPHVERIRHPNRAHGAEFPQTPAARKSTVIDEEAGGKAVLDHGNDEVEHGQQLARDAVARPHRPSEGTDEADG